MAKDPIAIPFRLGTHLVAGVWRYMLPPELSSLKVPEERHATCMRCPKIVTNEFREDYRCCTYHPRIPNFLIGLAFLHDADATALLMPLVEQGMMTPEGMIASPNKWADYVSELAKENFGKSHEIVCPLLNTSNGHCGVYAFRNAVCSSFFCYNDNGGKGEKFWEALETVGSQCELALGQWAMEELGFSVDAYFARLNELSPEDVSITGSHAWTPEARKVLWGEWYGREREFFIKTAQLISDNRDRLWEIANATSIEEAQIFEKKALACIPPAYREDAEKEQDAEEWGESESPKTLWRYVKKYYERLWAVPGGRFALAKRVTIIANPGEDAEEKFYSHLPYMVAVHSRQGSSKVLWREFVSTHRAAALGLFSKAQKPEGSVLQDLQTLLGDEDPKHFIAEWFGKKVLQNLP